MFEKVTSEHILKGIEDYKEKRLPNGFGPSSTYDLVYDGKKYPPKAVMAYANYHATGETPKNNFKGGPRHECFEAFKREGFQITPKEQNMNFVDVKEEFAVWLLNNAPISYKNYLGRTNSSVVERLEEIDNFFMERDLFLVNGENYQDLIKYIRFKNSKNERLKNPEFYEYDRKHSRGIPIAILGKENYSKFLKEKFEFRAVNYWIFQGNPNIYNIKNALLGGHLHSWKVAAHKDKIKIGDKVIIWQTGSEAGCYALAEVISNVGVFKEEPFEMQHYVVSQNSDETDRVRLKIDKYLIEQPVLWSQIKDLPEFANFKAGNQGTNFSATKEEYNTILALLEEDKDLDDFKKSIERYSTEDLVFYFNHLDAIVHRLGLSQGDKRVVYTCTGLFLNLNIGQRVAWRLDPRKDKKYHIMTDKVINENSGAFDGEPLHYYHVFNNQNELDQIRSSSFKASETELKRITKSGLDRHNNKYFELAVFDQSFRKQFIKTEIMESNKTVLNKILFGPPGTGKTYNTINDSLKIIDPEFYQENKNDRNYLNKRFKELLIKDFEDTKGQIAFCTFHQSFSYEDFVEGIKPKINDKKEVYYEVVDGIFKKICQLANSSVSAVKMHKEGKLSWDEAQFEQASFYKLSLGESTNLNDRIIYEYCRDTNVVSVGFGDDTDFSGMSENEINKKCEEIGLSEGSARRLNYFIHDLKNGNYVLVSNGNKYISCLGKVVGDYEYIEDSPIAYHHFRKVEWIFVDENIPVQEVYDTNFNQKTIYKLDNNRLKKGFFVDQNQQGKSQDKKVKDYILIIDEINRGNVSSIFGELITLIEPDKRAGKIEELEVTLPYSKEPFKVPHNVYIIGTMNTADRSIEALDTALRRRFSFVEKPPVPKLIKNEGKSGTVDGIVNGVNLKYVLETINERIEKLIDKDHKIGHSYFLKVDNKESLINCFENEVIPLLEEYFFGDYGKIGLVLGDSFVTKDETEDFKFANFAGYDADVSEDLKERSVYKIRPSIDWDFNSI